LKSTVVFCAFCVNFVLTLQNLYCLADIGIAIFWSCHGVRSKKRYS